MNPDNGRIKFATVGTTAEVSHLIHLIAHFCSVFCDLWGML